MIGRPISPNSDMTLKDFFEQKGIEYFRVIPYSACKEISSEIIAREGFSPASVVIYLLPYFVSEGENMSTYSTSLDYHLAISETNLALRDHLMARFPSSAVKGYGDHSPIDERHAALISGLGVLGRNGLLINEKYGTYVFIADVITDIPPEELGASEAVEIGYCEDCGLCLEACPTGILSGKGDSCLSFITQRKGELTEEELTLMRRVNTVWGCDECQRACPHNQDPAVTPLEFFRKDRITRLTLDRLSLMGKDELRSRAFGWRGRRVVERNLTALNYLE